VFFFFFSFFLFSQKVFIEVAFGGEFNSFWMTKYRELMENSSNFFVGLMIFGPVWKKFSFFLPKTWRFPSGKLQELRSDLKRLINARSQQNSSVGGSLLNAMFKEREEGIESGEQETTLLSADEEDIMIDECLTFLFASHDTTSNLLSWCVYFLTLHKEWQAILQQESDEILSGLDCSCTSETAGGFLQQQEFSAEQHLAKLVKHKHFIDETLRMRPPVPGLLDREVSLHSKFFSFLFSKLKTHTLSSSSSSSSSSFFQTICLQT